MSGMNERRVVNETTGGEKGQKDQRFELLPWGALGEVAALYAKGAEKYDDNNWRKGYAWSLSAGALGRHFAAFMEGEDYDSETGAHHLTSVVFHALALLEFKDTHPELDNRPSTVLAQPSVPDHAEMFRVEFEPYSGRWKPSKIFHGAYDWDTAHRHARTLQRQIGRSTRVVTA